MDTPPLFRDIEIENMFVYTVITLFRTSERKQEAITHERNLWKLYQRET